MGIPISQAAKRDNELRVFNAHHVFPISQNQAAPRPEPRLQGEAVAEGWDMLGHCGIFSCFDIEKDVENLENPAFVDDFPRGIEGIPSLFPDFSGRKSPGRHVLSCHVFFDIDDGRELRGYNERRSWDNRTSNDVMRVL